MVRCSLLDGRPGRVMGPAGEGLKSRRPFSAHGSRCETVGGGCRSMDADLPRIDERLLGGLLRAYLAVARADDLDVVLRHVVEAAGELVHARYAALGVIVDGRLVRFVHTGMPPETVAAIAHLPEGKGLLGLL